MTNGLSHPYHLDESTFILGAAGVTFHFYFAFYYIYIGSGTARFITVETRMFPDCADIAPTPTRWRHGCSRRLPDLSRYLTAFPVTPGCYKHFKTTGDMSRFNTVQHGSSRISKVVHGAATVVTKSILHMYCCGTRKSHPRTRIICEKRGSAEFLTKLFRSEGGISLSHNNTS